MGYPEGTGPEFHVIYADEKSYVNTYRVLLTKQYLTVSKR